MAEPVSGELFPRHLRALNRAVNAFLRAGVEDKALARDLRQAMREVREIAARDRMRRKYGN